jgi:hypothetical protein
MLSPRQFDVPTKIHFVTPEAQDVGSVYADCIVPHDGATSFYFGQSCVAILGKSYLLIGPRKIHRSALRAVKPYWCEPVETFGILPVEASFRSRLRASA